MFAAPQGPALKTQNPNIVWRTSNLWPKNGDDATPEQTLAVYAGWVKPIRAESTSRAHVVWPVTRKLIAHNHLAQESMLGVAVEGVRLKRSKQSPPED